MTTARPLIVITGPTASGKTSLAVDLAEQFGGEIICADSRTVYKGLDIGTAKPTKSDMARVRHWGLDLVLPNQQFSAADFKTYAMDKIADVRSRGKVPFLVGGTGLYVDSVIFDYKFGKPADLNRRRELESMTIEQLHEYCNKNNVILPENKLNKRYLIRNIERNGQSYTEKRTLIDNTIVVGIATEKSILRHRISLRVEQLINDGVVNEAKGISDKYGWDNEAMKGNAYPIIHKFLQNELTYDDFIKKLIVVDWRLAKRQLTWMRRNTYIKWGTIHETRRLLSDALANQGQT